MGGVGERATQRLPTPHAAFYSGSMNIGIATQWDGARQRRAPASISALFETGDNSRKKISAAAFPRSNLTPTSCSAARHTK